MPTLRYPGVLDLRDRSGDSASHVCNAKTNEALQRIMSPSVQLYQAQAQRTNQSSFTNDTRISQYFGALIVGIAYLFLVNICLHQRQRSGLG